MENSNRGATNERHVSQHNDTEHNGTQHTTLTIYCHLVECLVFHYYAECCYDECHYVACCFEKCHYAECYGT